MDDIHLEDPRKFSAKQIRAASVQASKKMRVFRYLFDLIIKTILCALLISLDFTLFANSGNYNIFTSSFFLNTEALYIYTGIALFSFLLMFTASFIHGLQNLFLALLVALLCVAFVNQFASFEKHSGLLIIFNGVFSDDVNLVLYKYSLWIIGSVIFVICWLLFNKLRRSFLLYLTILMALCMGWVLNEAYANTSSQYFKTVASGPILKDEAIGKNLIFLSFNSLTSPNNLAAMAQVSKQKINIQESFNNAIGFFTKNNFILYPNAMAKPVDNPFLNVVSSLNPDSDKAAEEHMQLSAIRDKYFIFDILQKDKIYLKDSSLYSFLRKNEYALNVFQSRGIDVCYLDNKLAVALCKQKINAPTVWSGGDLSPAQSTILLAAQWLTSTGLVDNLNPILKMADFILPAQFRVSMNFKPDEIYTVNSFRVFDQIIDSLERQSGNQAYIAVVDLPSETYIYDEFCHLKNMSQWLSEKNVAFAKFSSIDERRNAYADQINCLFGALDNFIRQLDQKGYLKDTTLIIEGLNTPQGLSTKETEYYRQLQREHQVMLAIHPASMQKADIDYSLCDVDDILNSFFFTHTPCEEFSNIKTTGKNLKHIQQMIDQDKYKKHVIDSATENFDKWSMAWQAFNETGVVADYQTKQTNKTGEPLQTLSGAQPKKITKPVVSPQVVEDVPEQEVKSISAATEETQREDLSPSGSEDTTTNIAEKEDNHSQEAESVIAEAKTDEPAADVSSSAGEADIPETETETEPEAEPTPVTEDASNAEEMNVTEAEVPNTPETATAAPADGVPPEVTNQTAPESADQTTENTVDEQSSQYTAATNITEDEIPSGQPDGVSVESQPVSESAEADAEDVLPDTLFDTQEEKNTAEEAIAKARKTLKAAEAEQAEQALDNLAHEVETFSQDPELKDILEAPATNERPLTPEELKRRFRQSLSEAGKNDNTDGVNIQIKVIEN